MSQQLHQLVRFFHSLNISRLNYRYINYRVGISHLCLLLSFVKNSTRAGDTPE